MWKITVVPYCTLWSFTILTLVAGKRIVRGTNELNADFDDTGDAIYAMNYADLGLGLGIINPYAFHQQLTNQILAQHSATQNAISSTYTLGDASVTAFASNGPLFNNEIQRQIAYFSNADPQAFYSGNDGHYAPNYAAAAASFGPDGAYQTAHIIPENPNKPNIVNHFAETSPGGLKSISVSSRSTSSDINGEKTSSRVAETTINDNGQITTYKVHS